MEIAAKAYPGRVRCAGSRRRYRQESKRGGTSTGIISAAARRAEQRRFSGAAVTLNRCKPLAPSPDPVWYFLRQPVCR